VTTREERIARNRAIAEKYYDGYHHSVERGRLTKAFDPADFAEEWIFASPYLGGETVQGGGTFLAEGSVANHALISEKIPDYKMDDLRVWPTEAGCAWRWRVNGHGLDGRAYAFWEQLFVWTDDDSKILRFEFYDDWHGFADTLVYAYGTSLDEFAKIEHYGSAPWPPGPELTIHPPAAPPRADPPSTDRVACNLAVARRVYEGYRDARDAADLAAIFSAQDFSEEWVLFSPWLGEVTPSSGTDRVRCATIAHRRFREQTTDCAVEQFEAWPTDDGCAWRWRVRGRAVDGTAYEFWEQCFVDVGHDGKVGRLETYADWQGYPQALGRATGLALAELTELDARPEP
jgi:hypothetical protein